VFVWDDDQTDALAFRLKPGRNDDIEPVWVPVALLRVFKRNAGPPLAQIAQWFMVAQLDGTPELPRDPALHPPSSAALLPLEGSPRRRYRYGGKSTWELVHEVVKESGRPVLVRKLLSLLSYSTGFQAWQSRTRLVHVDR